MSEPKISLIAFSERRGGFVFVAIPNERFRYLRTDASVVQVACPQCRVVVGEPCKNRRGGYIGGTHYERRAAAQRMWPRNEPCDLVLDPEPEELAFPPIVFPEGADEATRP